MNAVRQAITADADSVFLLEMPNQVAETPFKIY